MSRTLGSGNRTARSRVRETARTRVLGAATGAFALAMLVLVAWTGSAAASGSSAATITGSFTDGCRDFTSQAAKSGSQQTKDISHVEIHFADGRVVKNETISSSDYSLDGTAGDEIDFVIVKSGTTSERFDCVHANSPPTAALELKTPPVDQTLEHCYDLFAGGLACEASSPRTDWTSTSQIPDGGGTESGVFHWGCGAFGPCPANVLTVSFRGTGSSDADHDITSWSLEFGDGTSTSGSWNSEPPTEVVHDYGADLSSCSGLVGSCVVVLTVTDAAGQSDAETMLMVLVDQ